MDFDEELEPDIIGYVRYIDNIIQPASYDGIVCCQVLEYLPGEEFENVIKRIQYVIKDHGILILSLVCNNEKELNWH